MKKNSSLIVKWTYLDLLKNIEVKDIQYVTDTASFYEITIGVEYFRLINENYYNSEKRYFKMRMNSDLNAITITSEIPQHEHLKCLLL